MNTETQHRERIERVTDKSAKVVATCSEGDSWRQGDIEIRYLGKRKPTGVTQTETPWQLAPGTTKGSRHILASENATAYAFSDPTELEGPVLHCPGGIRVEHPEHGDIEMLESGYYAITYQRAMADEIRRQAD